MSTLVLVGYATRYGSTQEVAEAVAATLREHGLEVDIQPMRKVRTLAGYRAVVLGAPLFMFHWHKDALRFLSRHREALTERPVAIFVLGPTHDDEDEKEWQDSRTQIDKELAKFPWLTPVALEMFGGKYDPAKLRFPINLLAGKEPASDIRDWTAIRAWADSIRALLLQ
ncbi:MAG: flavodoxin domain-containing protein [Candidatus Thermoplasmatota archaeon]|nr:flavodoxin domain-containing protein [Candidatus Thermoplasmatota archaeon]